MDAELVRCKTFKTFNLKTANAILMKLTTIMYLHESVNRKPPRARNSVFWSNVYKCLDCVNNHHIYQALTYFISLVKFIYKFHEKHPKQVQNNCYANFGRSLKLGPKVLSSRNLLGFSNFMKTFIWSKTRDINWRASDNVA